MTIVVDSGVFASVIVKDEFYDSCKRYVTSEKRKLRSILPTLRLPILWKHVRMGRIPAEEATKRVELLKRLIDTAKMFGTKELLVDATKLAVEHGITVYDALFVALAVKLNAKLVTTDRKLAETLKFAELVL